MNIKHIDTKQKEDIAKSIITKMYINNLQLVQTEKT